MSILVLGFLFPCSFGFDLCRIPNPQFVTSSATSRSNQRASPVASILTRTTSEFNDFPVLHGVGPLKRMFVKSVQYGVTLSTIGRI
jgi:hypothetical protein